MFHREYVTDIEICVRGTGARRSSTVATFQKINIGIRVNSPIETEPSLPAKDFKSARKTADLT